MDNQHSSIYGKLFLQMEKPQILLGINKILDIFVMFFYTCMGLHVFCFFGIRVTRHTKMFR